MIRRLSLQTRLLILLALLLATLWAALEIATQKKARLRVRQDIAHQLLVTTDRLAAIAGADQLGRAERQAILDAGRDRGDVLAQPAYELLTRESGVLRSEPFPAFAAPPPPGIATMRAGSQEWRVLTIVDAETGTTRRAAVSETERRARVAALRDDLLVPWTIGLPLVAIAVLASVWIGLRPLRAIERRMTAISPFNPEPLGLRSERMPRELASLTRAFDGLAERLARVMTDQRIFASAASHELRTPLAGALSQLDVLRRAPERGAALDRLGEALAHMERLVGQLLFLARSDTVATTRAPEPVDLAAAAQAAGEELGLGAAVQIRGEGRLSGYPDLIRALLRNLLANAHAASEGALVEVEIVDGGRGIDIAVLDRGPGIPPAERPRLMEPFHRGVGRRRDGAGLGLTVAQRIAELHGGRIEIADRPGGGGAIKARLVAAPDPGGG